MSPLAVKYRTVELRPREFAEQKKLPSLLDLYARWYDGDVPLAKMALIQDLLEIGVEERGLEASLDIGVLKAVCDVNG